MMMQACRFLPALLAFPLSQAAWSDHRQLDHNQLAIGHSLFATHCTVCHGEQAEGAANWQQPGADGKSQPPPLNGTGHAWHHSLPQLFRTIKNGTLDIGGSMPAHAEKLNEDEILQIIYWITSLWPDELYMTWRANHP